MAQKSKIEKDKIHVAVLLIEILFEKGLVNRQTYINAKKHTYSHISHSSLPAIKLLSRHLPE